MNKTITFFSAMLFVILASTRLCSQTDTFSQELGISSATFLNFSVTDPYDYLIGGAYFSPYYRLNRHEFFIGLICPYRKKLFEHWEEIYPSICLAAGYKFYFYHRNCKTNLFLYYSFQYLRYAGPYDYYTNHGQTVYHFTQIENYYNNILGCGFFVFLNKKKNFSSNCTVGYNPSYFYAHFKKHHQWTAASNGFMWNYLDVSLGFNIKLASFE